MEFCSKGDLTNLMDIPLSEKHEIIKGVASGLAFLNGKGLFHRDVKLQNIIVNRDGIAKLSDFGFCTTKRRTVT